VGDVLAGNIELRGSCACGHSASVNPEESRRRSALTERVKYISFRCQQGQRYGSVSIQHPPR
jgi:hypothetical protein